MERWKDVDEDLFGSEDLTFFDLDIEGTKAPEFSTQPPRTVTAMSRSIEIKPDIIFLGNKVGDSSELLLEEASHAGRAQTHLPHSKCARHASPSHASSRMMCGFCWFFASTRTPRQPKPCQHKNEVWFLLVLRFDVGPTGQVNRNNTLPTTSAHFASGAGSFQAGNPRSAHRASGTNVDKLRTHIRHFLDAGTSFELSEENLRERTEDGTESGVEAGGGCCAWSIPRCMRLRSNTLPQPLQV